MTEMSEKETGKAIFLRNDEFTVLLMLFHIRTICGFHLEEMDGLNDAEVKRALFSLVQKGFLTEREGKMEPEGLLREIFGCILDAKEVLYASENHNGKQICFYRADKTAAVQLCGQEGKHVKAGLTDSVLAELKENGYLMEEILSDELLYREEALPENEALPEEETLPGKDALSGKEGETVLRFLSPLNGTETRRIVLKRQPLEDILIERMGNEKTVYRYSERKLKELLCR